jgi:hypothetical protein
MQTSTNPQRRQSRCVGLGVKGAEHPIPIAYILITWHGTARTTPSPFFFAFLDCTYASPSISPLRAEDDDGKPDSYVKRECNLKGHIPYQRDLDPNEYSSGRMAIFNCGTTNADGWHVSWSNSRYVASFERGFCHQSGPLAK